MSAPYLRGSVTARTRCRDALIAMAPCLIAAWYFYGPAVLLLLICAAAGCAAGEAALSAARRTVIRLDDLSFLVSALVLTLLIPAGTPWWAVLAGGALAGGVKGVWGGLGKNWLNPAALAALILYAARLCPAGALDEGVHRFLGAASGGPMGGCAPLLIALGYGFLCIRGLTRPTFSLCFLLTALAPELFLNVPGGIMGGTLLLAALFCGSDGVTTPLNMGAQVILGAFCGLATAFLRAGLAIDGALLALLAANLLTRPLDRIMN